MIHLEVVGSSASPRANLLSRLGLLDSREGGTGRLGTPSTTTTVYRPPTHPVPTARDAPRIIRIPSTSRKKGSRRAVQKIASSHQEQHNVPLPEAAEEELPSDYIASVNRAIVSIVEDQPVLGLVKTTQAG